MRIVSGTYRGTKISYPEGEQTRPTRDKVRESVFNILEHAPWSEGVRGAFVMDVFAGTGALGLEALSRGAEEAVFVEKDRKALTCCEENIKKLKTADKARVLVKDAVSLPPRTEAFAPRSLIFLDPPYRHDFGERALVALAEGGWLLPDATMVFEMAKEFPENIPDRYEIEDERVYGIALIKFLRFLG